MNCHKANNIPRRSHYLCVAPMMGVSDTHARRFWRLLAPQARLYTEMLTANAVRFGAQARLLAFAPAEQPLALQLGGSDPQALADATAIAADFGYCEVNLNAGCPSTRVQDGRFGACLMRVPALVADCLAAMRAAAPGLTISVKCRLGVDEQTDDALWAFLDAVHSAGVRHIIIHARKAWLQGVSPKDNRDLPPLQYALVHAAKRRYADCCIILNGGLRQLDDVATQLPFVDGVMLGRAVWHNPWILAELTRHMFGQDAAMPVPAERAAAVQAILPYIIRQYANIPRLLPLIRPLLGLYYAQPGGRYWRYWLTNKIKQPKDLADAVAMMARYLPRPMLRSA